MHRRRFRGAPLVVLLAGALALVLSLAALRDDTGGRRVAVATRDLGVGTRLRRADVRFEPVAASAGALERLVGTGDAWVGRVVTTPVPRGALLTDLSLRTAATDDGRRAMSIPVERARAVNGRLGPGDRVDVVQARDGVAEVVAAGLEVLDLEDDRAGAFGGTRGQVTVTLAVDVADSQRLAAVLADGDFVLTRVTGSTSAAGAPPVVLGAAGSGAPDRGADAR